jgi:predicted Zn-dependent peptidase
VGVSGPELIALANGVRVAFDPMPLETAALSVAVRVGARWERAEENGIAHLFEHMAFKGAGGRDALAFAEAIENVGGYLNAATGYERTSYTARIVADEAPFALDLIADMMLDPHWTPDDLEKEKGVVTQERGEAFDSPDDRVFEIHQAALFADQPLGRPILGDEATVAQVGVEDLRAFRDAHTTPARLVISIAGGYDRARVLETAERRFGALAPADPIPAAPAALLAGERTEARKLEQTHLVLTAGGYAAGDDNGVAAHIFSEIFGGGMASRLFQDVRETRGLVYAIHSYIDAYEDVGRIGVYAGCAAKNARTVAHCVADAFEALARDGPTDAEMKRAKAVVSASMLMGAETPSARAEARSSQAFLRNRIVPFAELRARVAAVTADDVSAVAARAIAGPIAAAAVGPKTGLGAAGAFRARFG